VTGSKVPLNRTLRNKNGAENISSKEQKRQNKGTGLVYWVRISKSELITDSDKY
jgi:hypothetical protein